MEEFKKPIYNIKSDKFIVYPFLSGIDKEVLIKIVRKHIDKLQKEIDDLNKCSKYKVTSKSLAIERINFEMMISSLEYQIKWHEALIDEIDECVKLSKNIDDFINNIDFSEINNLNIKEVQKRIFK
jgi:hypothetical protein